MKLGGMAIINIATHDYYKKVTLWSSEAPEIFKSMEYISAEKHCGVSKCIDKQPNRESAVNQAGMLI